MMRSPSRFLAPLALLLGAACSPNQEVLAPATAASTASASLEAGGPRFVAGELLVKFKPGATATNRGRAIASARATVGEQLVTAAMRRGGDAEGVTVLRTGMGVPEAVQAMLASGTVEYAEPNWIYTHQAMSNDPLFTNGSLWGMYGGTSTPANQFGSGAAVAWANGNADCSAVYVGIIDEGYMYTHEDLAANAATNPGEAGKTAGVDDDGNGYVDDIYGWDFVDNTSSVYDGAGDDHGTHVAGTIGAVGGNGKGVAGVCWNVKLMNGKFLGASGGSTANAVRAVDYFTDLKTRHDLNIVATSNSWGGGGFSQTLADAISRANAASILFIAAAGNSALNCERRDCFPAEYANANVIAVASMTATGAMSSFSNYGSTTIDIGAPGSDIWSTLPGAGTYGSYSGTSMATPHVSGAAALYRALNPNSTASEVKAAILSTATPTSSMSGRTVTGGRLNAAGLIGITTPVTAPSNVQVTIASNKRGKTATITWTSGGASGFDVYRIIGTTETKIKTNLSTTSTTDPLSGTGSVIYKVCNTGATTLCASSTSKTF